MEILGFVALIVLGFTAGAEFASFAFVHPVIRRLPPEPHVRVEQGFLRTFGRVMPVLMPLSIVLTIAYTVVVADDGVVAWLTAGAAAATCVAATVTTVKVNLPINSVTAGVDPTDPPDDWDDMRRRWEEFQAIRSLLLLAGFALLCASVVFGD